MRPARALGTVSRGSRRRPEVFHRTVGIPIVSVLMLAWVSSARANVYSSKPELANGSVGLLETKVRGYWYRGSGTVARDPRLIYSCAHVVYDRGRWADDYVFHRAWHDRSFPKRATGAFPRGFHYLTAYARAARYTNGESNASFANDFTVFYGFASFGPAAAVQEASARLLRGTSPKRILGYPAEIDYTGARGFAYQHSTGWFPNRAIQILGAFHDFRGVSTGSGNSGGGIFLKDPASGNELLAGILVAGSFRTAGVVAMTQGTRDLADAALGSASASAWRATSSRLVKPSSGDLSRACFITDVTAEGPLAGEMSWTVRLDGTPGPAPKAWLQSPSGRVQRIAADGTSRTSDVFAGCQAGGPWRLVLATPQDDMVPAAKIELAGQVSIVP